MKALIISTGDISDVDGFLALSEYAKTGADVLFVMSYPAYIGVQESEVDPTCDTRHPGLGYKYSAQQVFALDPDPAPGGYKKFFSHYMHLGYNDRMKAAMTDIAYTMANRVWAEECPNRGNLYFGIGGINSINPFSESAIKNEVLVYSQLISEPEQELDAVEGAIYNSDAKAHSLLWETYSDIYIDFSGSMAFLNYDWLQQLSDSSVASKVRGVFVMGGVHSDAPPLTMPSIQGVLNRFSSATMNQLYHPERTSDIFAFVAKHQIPTFTVTNNVVADLSTFADADKKVKTLDGIHAFMSANNLAGPFLRQLADCYYTSRHNPPRKAFDYHTALVLRSVLDADARGARHDALISTHRRLFYSATLGTTFVSSNDDWPATLSAYAAAIDTEPRDDDAPFVRAKKDNFRRELDVMRSLPALPSLAVCDVAFERDDAGAPGSRPLRIRMPPQCQSDSPAASPACTAEAPEPTQAAPPRRRRQQRRRGKGRGETDGDNADGAQETVHGDVESCGGGRGRKRRRGEAEDGPIDERGAGGGAEGGSGSGGGRGVEGGGLRRSQRCLRGRK